MIFVNLVVRILAATAAAFALSLFVGGSSFAWDDLYRDALLRVRDPVPVSRELLLVSGRIPGGMAPHGEGNGDGHKPGDSGAVELLWTLAELEAERVLLSASWQSVELSDLGTSESGSELTSRLDAEFARIDENIAELFEAIRIGSIEPREAERFVEQLRQLVENSNARIQDELIQNAGTSRVSVEDLIDAFGSDRLGMELSDLGISLPGYSSAVALPIPPGGGTEDEQQFRRLTYSSLTRYMSRADRLAARLSESEEAGYFDETDPRNRPSIMRDHLRSLRMELYEQPSEPRAQAWRDAVDAYFETTGRLIDADAQDRLTERLRTLEETENLDDESAAQILEMKAELANTFATLRQDYAELIVLRQELTEEVAGSLVILADVAVPGDASGAGGERRAVVANSALVGENLRAPTGRERTLLLTAAGLLIGIVLAPFRVGVAVALSPVALVVGAAVFAALFVVADIWIAPVSVAVVLFGATGAVSLATGLSQGRVERTLTGRAVDRLPSPRLRRTIFRGGLRDTDTGRRRAAVVVVVPDVRKGVRASELESFHRAICHTIRERGGIVFGEEGLSVFAAFDTRRQGDDGQLVHAACAAVKELVSATVPAGITARCGVDFGDLIFYVSPIGGYRATGRTVTYARRFSDLARKYRQRALFGESVVTACGTAGHGDTRRFVEKGKLVVSSAGDRYPFYRLIEIDPPSP